MLYCCCRKDMWVHVTQDGIYTIRRTKRGDKPHRWVLLFCRTRMTGSVINIPKMHDYKRTLWEGVIIRFQQLWAEMLNRRRNRRKMLSLLLSVTMWGRSRYFMHHFKLRCDSWSIFLDKYRRYVEFISLCFDLQWRRKTTRKESMLNLPKYSV